MMTPPAICIDFDETLASYAGWRSEGFVEITGEPLPGAKEAIDKVIEDTRSHRIVTPIIRDLMTAAYWSGNIDAMKESIEKLEQTCKHQAD